MSRSTDHRHEAADRNACIIIQKTGLLWMNW